VFACFTKNMYLAANSGRDVWALLNFLVTRAFAIDHLNHTN